MMRPQRILTPLDAIELFDHAVRERALAVVTLQEADDWISFKCRFLERDPQRRFFVLDHQPSPDEVRPVLTPGQYVGVSFRHKNRKVLFATIIEARGRYMIDKDTSVDAIRYRWPDAMAEYQRRAYYRTPVPADTPIPISLWKGSVATRNLPEGGLELYTGKLNDLSCGGSLVRLDATEAPKWADNQTVGAEIHLPDGRPPMLVNAHFRGARNHPDGSVSVALQFVGMEMTADGRANLQRAARFVQRLHRFQRSERSPEAGARLWMPGN